MPSVVTAKRSTCPHSARVLGLAPVEKAGAALGVVRLVIVRRLMSEQPERDQLEASQGTGDGRV